MHPRRFALIGGIVMLAMGIISLIPSLKGSADSLPFLNLETSYGLFLGIFPMNIVNKVALIVFGLLGIQASNAKFTSLPMSTHYSRLVFYVMGALAILGMIPQTNTLFGYWPLFGGEVLGHAAFALFGAYFGFMLSSKVPDSGPRQTDFRTPLTQR